MNILALETSAKASSCALLRDGVLAGEFFINTALTHSQTILPMVQGLLQSTGATVGDIDLFAVSTGPGSFTGLRIGISAVKGMAMAMDRPCVAVSTLEALAENAAAFSGTVIPAMDARRAQVYTAAFDCREQRLTRLTGDTALSIAQVREQVLAAGSPVLFVGDGAALCAEAMGDIPHAALAPEHMRHQRAGSVARVAARLAGEGNTCTADSLEPAYLRLPQAERERLARLQPRRKQEEEQ